ncbi:MAG: UxaA family hydrolase [Candidatus Bathyarchaeia archaeon]
MLSGYSRINGKMGARNHVAIIPTAGCVNDFIRKIEQNVPGTVPILHHQGCAQLKPDLEQVTQILIGLGINPNVTGVLVVSLGCESIVPQEVVDGIASSGKPVSLLSLQEEGGYTKALQKGIDVASKMCVEANTQERKPFSLEDLVLGIKCGASDTTSGLVANPVIGVVVDRVIDAGGTVIFGETTEIIGAEHILAKRAVNQRVSKRVYEIVERMEAKAKALGVDMRGSQPTGGNIRGGLTSIEEKSLGAIVKGGSRPLQGVLEYGERPIGKGLYFMDSPGMEIVYLTGPAAGGVQALLFSTGLGAPQGFPLYPVIKVCGNERTSNHLAEHIDVDVSPVLRDEETLAEAGDRLFTELVQVVSGKKTNAETLGFDSTVDIYTLGSFI